MDWNLCDARHRKGGAVTTAATTQLSPRRELPDRRLSPDGELLVCADSIEASRLTRHQRDHTACVWTEADRPGCTADHARQDRQGASDPWRGDSPAHAPRGVYGHPRHH